MRLLYSLTDHFLLGLAKPPPIVIAIITVITNKYIKLKIYINPMLDGHGIDQ